MTADEYAAEYAALIAKTERDHQAEQDLLARAAGQGIGRWEIYEHLPPRDGEK